MTNGGFYKNVNCYFTNEGRTTFAKQDNGIKFSKLGAVVFSDKNHTLINAIKAEDFAAINNITLKQLNTYTQLIFGNISYTYSGGTYIPASQEEVNESITNHKNLLNVAISYERNSEDDYFSYDFTLEPSSLNIDSISNDDFNFDGFAILGLPYKTSDLTEYNIEQQTPTVLALIYFEDDNEKLQILYNQPDKTAMTVELHINLENEIYLGAIEEYVDTNGEIVDKNIATRNFIGLRQVNDGSTNVDMNNPGHGTDANVLISNMNTDTTTAYDSFAKLNIMTEAVDNVLSAVPQIMLAQTTSGTTEKSWKGDRLEINYASGNDGGYFRISEITGTYRNRLNFELFGQNNFYNANLKGCYGNSFIYSTNNKLKNYVHNNAFIHSDYNSFEEKFMSEMDFINSNFNFITATTGELEDQKAYAQYVSLYNSNNNVIHPKYETIAGTSYKKGLISRATLINSNYNYIEGKSTTPSTEGFYEPSQTFINSFSSYYNLREPNSLTMIGSEFNFINATTGNIIGIGEGLIQNGGAGDKIILGNYNKNSTDPNEILVVGDGRMNTSYVEGLVSNIPDWNLKEESYKNLFGEISGEGSTAKDANFYRHNIFTVNKDGYITISDYDTNKSARYGFSGISAYNDDGSLIDINFNEIYNQLNVNKKKYEDDEDIGALITEATNLLNIIPNNRVKNFTNSIDSQENITFSAYINPTATLPESVNSSAINIDEPVRYTIYNFTYYPTSNKNAPARLIWYFRAPGTTTFEEKSTLIQPYTNKRLMFIDVDKDKTTNTTISGFTEVC